MKSTLQKQRMDAIATHSAQADQFARSYATAADGYECCFAYSRMRLEESLACYLPPEGYGLHLLDVGCGTGHHMKALASRGYIVAGVDGSEAMLEYARA